MLWEMRISGAGKDGERMKKSWIKRMAAAAVVLTIGATSGITTLLATGEGQETSENPGGGIYETEDNNSIFEHEVSNDILKEGENTAESTEEAERNTTESEPDIEEPLPGNETGIQNETIPKQIKPKEQKKSESVPLKKQIAENGQTVLDVSQGDIRITETGAEGGGLQQKETILNEKGYWITGTTNQYNIIVEEQVETSLTLEDVNITCDSSKMDCINVSHADVIITLKGNNVLICNAGNNVLRKQGCALAKDGMDGSLTLQCESADMPGHKCSETCGSLTARGNEGIKHAGAIGNTVRNSSYSGIAPVHMGFANFTIKGGIIEASGGEHCPGIGSACVTEDTSKGLGYTKNIRISGGIVKATGTEYGSGIGSGYGNKVEGIYITGGTVIAKGGKHAPGIGASDFDGGYKVSGTTEHLEISGGDTLVTAVGDQSTNMPGIGSARGESYNSGVAATPDAGYQGYIQDGESADNYIFAEGTPFSGKTDIKVGKFFTMVYFGPYRDANEIQSDTKEQLGANHVISKTGGEAFTKEQLKALTRVTGKQQDGTDFLPDQVMFGDEVQIEAINQAKKNGEIGEYPLTLTTAGGTQVTVTVFLRSDGTDAAEIPADNPVSIIGANDFQSDTGGDELTEEEVKTLGNLKAKDKDGNNIPLDQMKVSQDDLKKINEAKTSKKNGSFQLTFETADGQSAVVTVTLTGARDVETEGQDGDKIKANNVISKTGGAGFSEEQLKELTSVAGSKENGMNYTDEDFTFSDPSQITAINKAKKAGETGEFALTIQTPKGTQATVTVFLRQEGSDGAEHEHGNQKVSIGANDIIQKTGGVSFSKIEIIDLCGALAKNKNGDNTEILVSEDQLDAINLVKTSGKTGVFDLTFSAADGIKVTVKVILTGSHTVSFDSDGGNYTPEIQKVEGGTKADKPKDPERDGYTFDGWYYTDEQGKEQKWNFDAPVNQSMELKAKWSKIPEQSEDTTKHQKTEQEKESKFTRSDKADKKEKEQRWNYKEIHGGRKGQTAKTGDHSRMLWIFGCVAGAVGIGLGLFSRKRRRQ